MLVLLEPVVALELDASRKQRADRRLQVRTFQPSTVYAAGATSFTRVTRTVVPPASKAFANGVDSTSRSPSTSP